MARYRVGLETRERILGATRELLAEGGVDAVTLKAIAARAEVGAVVKTVLDPAWISPRRGGATLPEGGETPH